MNDREIDEKLGTMVGECYTWVLNEIKKNIAKDQMSEYGEELLHFMIIELYNKSPEYKLDLIENKKVPFWLLTSSGLQLRSGSSPFYRQIRQTRMSSRSGDVVLDNEIFEDYDPTMWDCYQEGMEKVGFYYRKLLEEKYLNEMSFKDISRKYQISLNHIRRDIYIGLEMIRNHCKHV